MDSACSALGPTVSVLAKHHKAERAAAKALLDGAYDYRLGRDPKVLVKLAMAYQEARYTREEAARANRRRYKYHGESKSKTQQIYEYIKKYPGCHANAIERDLGIPGTRTRPIVHYLREQGFVAPASSKTWGRYFPAKKQ